MEYRELLFFRKINNENGCWIWQGHKEEFGHGQFWADINGSGLKIQKAHRYSYYLFHGKIDDNLVIDHLCRNPSCVNPFHLELVTQRENLIRGYGCSGRNFRKTHCIRGHDLNDPRYARRQPHAPNQRRCLECRRVVARGKKLAQIGHKV